MSDLIETAWRFAVLLSLFGASSLIVYIAHRIAGRHETSVMEALIMIVSITVMLTLFIRQ